MKKVATLLVFVLMIQIATPSFAQNSTAQTQSLQRCIDEIIGKSLSAENLKNVDLGNRKVVDKLSAAKHIFLWAAGDAFSQHSKSERFIGRKTQVVAGLSVGVLLVITAGNMNKGSGALALLGFAFVLVGAEPPFEEELDWGGNGRSAFADDILDASSFHDFYQAIANGNDENANAIRHAAIAGCQELHDQIWHFIDQPDVFLTDLEQIGNKGLLAPVIVDSSLVDGIETPNVRIPSAEKGYFRESTKAVGQ